MDPAFIAVIGTLGGGILIKMFETAIKRHDARKAGSVAILGYEDRWKDPAYVKMIHATRKGEVELFGHTNTQCFCPNCTAVKGVGCGFMGCGHTDCAWECVPDKPQLPSAAEEKTQIVFIKSGMRQVGVKDLNDIIKKNRNDSLEHQIQMNRLKTRQSALQKKIMAHREQMYGPKRN